MNNSRIIQVESLSKTFSINKVQNHVLNNLNIDIYDKEFVVIMGASGSGKSTLLYSISGIDKPTLGEIKFLGEKISDYNNDKLAKFRRNNCGFIFQDSFLNSNMSVLDNVLVAGFLLGGNKKEIISKAKNMLDSVGITKEYHNRFPSQLSGGEIQRVGIVRAIINDPKVVFADEPTGALNSQNSKNVLDLLNKINKDGIAVVMVTHDIQSAIRGDRVLYLKDGVILNELVLGKYVESESQLRIDKLNTFLKEMGW